MKILRFLDQTGQEQFGALQADGKAALFDACFYSGAQPTDTIVEVGKLLAPIVPAGIIGIGLNYGKLAAHLGKSKTEYPITFSKLANAIQHPGDPIVLPTHLPAEQVDYEGELVVVIGKECRNVSAADALDNVFGYTLVNDITAKDWQTDRAGGQWFKAKNFDTFCPFGPCVVTADEIPDPSDLRLTTRLNGEVVQDESTSDLLFKIPEIIEYLSGSMTLAPGTIILTGSPMGVGSSHTPPKFLKPGDEVRISIPQIGELVNPVIAEA